MSTKLASNKSLSVSTSITRPSALLLQFTKKQEAVRTVYCRTWQKNKYLVNDKSHVTIKVIININKPTKGNNVKMSASSQPNLGYSCFKKRKSSTLKMNYVRSRRNSMFSTKILLNTHIHCLDILSRGIISNLLNRMLRTQMSTLAIPSQANVRSLLNLEFSPDHWPSSTTKSIILVNWTSICPLQYQWINELDISY